MQKSNNKLIVEGKDDTYTIAELMGKHVDWPRDNCPVDIISAGGDTEILRLGFISTHLKTPSLKALGIIIDADESASTRWQHVSRICSNEAPDWPENITEDGLIIKTYSGIQLGLWIMPDNTTSGMLETFLSTLIDEPTLRLWNMAKSSVSGAIQSGAPCRTCHIDKANIHTWLAWQDPPGARFNTAIKSGVFKHDAEKAQKFIAWFKSLYSLR
ncbi:MAG: DUF3226 domain-containing protein [Acidithiobacillus sp.]